MSAQVTHVRLHTTPQVLRMIQEAWIIAVDESPEPAHVEATFNKACDLLAAGVVLQPAPSIPFRDIDLSGFKA